MLFSLFATLRGFFEREEVPNASRVFFLCTTVTAVILWASAIAVTAYQFVGEPIYCINDFGDKDKDKAKAVSTYCWVTSTFTISSHFLSQVGEDAAHPGVGTNFGGADDVKQYPYYQWVGFVLLFQGILTYLPRMFWNNWEGGRMNALVSGLQVGLRNPECTLKWKKIVSDYLILHANTNNIYAFMYLFCECLVLINIVGQIHFMDAFLGGDFLHYGTRVTGYSNASSYDHMNYVFPKVTKCTFHFFGPTGTIQNRDSLCVLPINVTSEKVYLFIWFWYILWTVLLSILVLYRLLMFALPFLRSHLLLIHYKFIPTAIAVTIGEKTSFGDWWLLYSMGRTMDPTVYRDILFEYSAKVDRFDVSRSTTPVKCISHNESRL